MTSSLLEALGGVRGPLGLKLLAAIVVMLFIPLALLVDGLRAASSSIATWCSRRTRVAHCPRGHAVELIGAWKCPACHLVQEGHAFRPCPHCGEEPHAVLCACGLPVENPLSPVRR